MLLGITTSQRPGSVLENTGETARTLESLQKGTQFQHIPAAALFLDSMVCEFASLLGSFVDMPRAVKILSLLMLTCPLRLKRPTLGLLISAPPVYKFLLWSGQCHVCICFGFFFFSSLCFFVGDFAV